MNELGESAIKRFGQPREVASVIQFPLDLGSS
jgi:hypothetical protein